MYELHVRYTLTSYTNLLAHRPTDAPGLLFYYLFEDWGATFNLISRHDRGYAAELDRLVSAMWTTIKKPH